MVPLGLALLAIGCRELVCGRQAAGMVCCLLQAGRKCGPFFPAPSQAQGRKRAPARTPVPNDPLGLVHALRRARVGPQARAYLLALEKVVAQWLPVPSGSHCWTVGLLFHPCGAGLSRPQRCRQTRSWAGRGPRDTLLQVLQTFLDSWIGWPQECGAGLSRPRRHPHATGQAGHGPMGTQSRAWLPHPVQLAGNH